MTMTADTSTIIDTAKNKLAATTQLEFAKATLCRFGGFGVLAAMVGAGIGLACFGYSYVADSRTQALKMADAFVQALEKAKFTTTGEIRLADGSTVSLVPGGQVTLAPNSVVRVDRSSNLGAARITNGGTTPTSALPSIQATPSPENKVITQFTTFKTVSFGKGQVVTGWNFENSNQANPTNQYCYYSERTDGTTLVRTDIGKDGRMLENLEPQVGGDVFGAFNKCVWFFT